jgi:hypothetical protein
VDGNSGNSDNSNIRGRNAVVQKGMLLKEKLYKLWGMDSFIRNG